MKKHLLISFTVLTAMTVFFDANAQNVGIGTNTPNASAILDIQSANKGLLVPQVSLTGVADLITVSQPATGLLVYNINAALAGGTGFYYNSGTPVAPNWIKLQSGAGGGGSGWGLSGNAGTDTATNFLGTLDSIPLRLRVNNKWAGQLGMTNVLLGRNSGSIIEETATSGGYNVGIGNSALRSNIAGYSNVAIGSAAMFSNFSDNSSVAIGDTAMLFNDDPFQVGNINTAIGSHSMLFSGFAGNGDGFYNTAVGGYSLFSNDIGNGNTAIGTFADVSDTGWNNSTVIGFGAVVDDSNKVQIGNQNVTSIGGQVGWTTFSDGRYKKDIRQDVKGLDFIMQLRPLTYYLDMQKLSDEKMARFSKLSTGYSLKNGESNVSGRSVSRGNPLARYNAIVKPDTRRYTGFIAQEVEAAAKNVGYDFSGVDKPSNGKGKYGIRYADFVVPLIKAMQEQQTIIDSQNQKIDALEQRLAKLELNR
ncbi:MAG: tail fiber domain-containing protein [Ferruginibacter sp.]